LIKQFIALNTEDELRLYAPHLPLEQLPENPRVKWRLLPNRRLWSQIQLSKELRHNEPDVVFVPSHVIPILSKTKSVVTIHDLAYYYFPKSYSPFDRRYLNFTTAVSLEKATKIITPSQATKKDILKFHHVNEKKIIVIPHGYNEHIFNQTVNYQNSPLKNPYYFYVGRIEQRKNIKLLIEAFVLLARKNEKVELVLAGKNGYGYQEIFNQLDNLPLNIRARIIVPGYLPQYDTARYLKHALAFVFPSLYEGFGIPVLESMAIGTPVITSSSSSLPEVSGNAGLLLPPNNPTLWSEAMADLLEKPNLRQEMSLNGLEQAKKFSWRQSAQKTLEVIRDAARN